MGKIKFNIELVSLDDGSWHAEATTDSPEAKIFAATENRIGETLVTINRQIKDWIESLPESIRPGYQPPVFAPGTLVEHIKLPGVVLVIVDGPKDSEVHVDQKLYKVEVSSGEVVSVLSKNLLFLEKTDETKEKTV